MREVEFVYNGLCSYMKFKLFNFVNLILMIGRIIWGGGGVNLKMVIRLVCKDVENFLKSRDFVVIF